MKKLHRFMGEFNLNNERLKIYDTDFLNQIKNVLRLKMGDKIILSDGKLNEAIAQIINSKKDFLEVEIQEIYKNKNEPEIRAILYCSILKRENFELVVQKVTEAGIKEIFPLITKRTVKLDIKNDRLEKIIKEATEQSGRGIVPVLHCPINFQSALEKVKENDINFFFDISGESTKEQSAISNKPHVISLFVGPEGGWDEEEIQSARSSGCRIVSLGKLTLRAETAAIIASYIVTGNLLS